MAAVSKRAKVNSVERGQVRLVVREGCALYVAERVYYSGAEISVSAEEAKQLVEQGVVERHR